MPTRRWRTLLTPPASGVANMALDEALMERAAATGDWTCRVYGWSEPTISFGRNQAAVRHYDRERIECEGIAVVRRPTGGRAILHHREITYSVAGPVTDAGGLHESYLLINQLLVDGLRALGVEAAMHSRTPALPHSPPGPVPCFDHPSSGELVAGGRKLVGSAQWRSDKALLQHGSILVDDDQGRLADFLREPTPAPPPAATLRELLGHAPSLDDVSRAIFSAIESTAEPLDLQPQLLDSQSRLALHFADPAWTWRR